MRKKYIDIYYIESFNSNDFNIDFINMDKILFQNKIWKLCGVLYLYKVIKYNTKKKLKKKLL